MPKTRSQKEMTLAELVESLKNAKSVVFSGFSGLKVKEVTELRRLLRAEKIELLVVKRTLFARALKEAGLPEPDDQTFAGGMQAAFATEDEVAPARILFQYGKKNRALTLRGGLLGKQLLSPAQVTAMATLPSLPALRGQVVGLIAAPLRGFVTVLAGPMRGLVTVLSKHSEKSAS